jgi:hypothetical protein
MSFIGSLRQGFRPAVDHSSKSRANTLLDRENTRENLQVATGSSRKYLIFHILTKPKRAGAARRQGSGRETPSAAEKLS